jgi:hypothetical protein
MLTGSSHGSHPLSEWALRQTRYDSEHQMAVLLTRRWRLAILWALSLVAVTVISAQAQRAQPGFELPTVQPSVVFGNNVGFRIERTQDGVPGAGWWSVLTAAGSIRSLHRLANHLTIAASLGSTRRVRTQPPRPARAHAPQSSTTQTSAARERCSSTANAFGRSGMTDSPRWRLRFTLSIRNGPNVTGGGFLADIRRA